MNQPSDEQQTVIQHIINGSHVIVDACAGSGKSTTVLSCANQLPQKQFLQCTYNRQLRVEVEEKVQELGIKNLDVYNYHSIAKNFYSNDGHTDTGIREILRHNLPPFRDIPKYDIVVLDETQDMTHLYFELLVKYLLDMPGNHTFQMLILGDKMQGLYQFKGSDERFLTLSERCWNAHPRLTLNKPFIQCALKTSYRITNQMSDFVNCTMLGEERLFAQREGSPVKYVRRDTHNIIKLVSYQIREILKNSEDTEADIFCLNASVKSDGNLKQIENTLVELGIPCFVPSDETQEQLDPRVIENKIVFSTFHSVKGRQRKHVFVFGFDESYFHFFARNLPESECPATLYVACTRATKHLTVIESCQQQTDRPLPFLQMNHAKMKRQPFINFQGTPMTMAPTKKPKTQQDIEKEKRKTTRVTDLIKFIPEEILDVITPLVQEMFVDMRPDHSLDPLEIPSIVKTNKGFYEDVSDINGIALPIMFYDHLRKKPSNTLQEIVNYNMKDVKTHKHAFLQKAIADMPLQCCTKEEYLYTTNLSIATQDKLYSKLTQISRTEDDYNWLDDNVVQKCFERIDEVVGHECQNESDWTVEETIIQQHDEVAHIAIDHALDQIANNRIIYRFVARVDLLTQQSLWEMKCTSELGFEHKLQLILYMWLYCMSNEKHVKIDQQTGEKQPIKQGFLFNIKTGEWFKLVASLQQMTEVAMQIIKGKFHETATIDDEMFASGAREKIVELANRHTETTQFAAEDWKLYTDDCTTTLST